MTTSQHLKVISLFTGVGGLDHGFEAAGFRTAAAVEMDGECCAFLRRNRPLWPLFEADIHDVPSGDILRAAGLELREADVLIGGPPCQPFSKSGWWSSGESLRLGDPRASTLGAYMRVLRETLPRTFLLENVEGLGFRGKDEGLRLILNELDAINRETGTRYKASIRVLNAADFGVPQLRRRLFVVGDREGKTFEFPAPTHADPAELVLGDVRMPHTTTWDVLHDLPAPNVDLRLRGKWAALLPSIPEGENYLWHTNRGGGVPLFGWRRRFWNFLLKISKDKPSWTIQAQPGPATGPFHWDNRRLSARELARLQTFPDDLVHSDRIAVAHHQMGNAVPSLLAEVIARAMRGQLLDGGVDLLGVPLLAVSPACVPSPGPARAAPVPKEYLHLVGEHEAHPGTGRGAAAVRRPGDAASLKTESARG